MKRILAALAIGCAWLAACGWDPSRPFDRDAPAVRHAMGELDGGDAGCECPGQQRQIRESQEGGGDAFGSAPATTVREPCTISKAFCGLPSQRGRLMTPRRYGRISKREARPASVLSAAR